MRVASCPIMEVPVALIERPDPRQVGVVCRVLLFREGLLAAPIIALLGRLLQHL